MDRATVYAFTWLVFVCAATPCWELATLSNPSTKYVTSGLQTPHNVTHCRQQLQQTEEQCTKKPHD